jgi:23S rRNA U2552 (ribose-2'-O)-methylase RlmE/FtsJ
MQGWQNPEADGHFERQRQQADQPTERNKDAFYKMTCAIGKELNVATGAIQRSSNLAVLDLCMAPGGFTTAALKHNQSAHVCGISLPVDMGGYEIRFPDWEKNSRITVKLLDITMLAAEMGVDIHDEIPASHPDAGRFLSDRPFEGKKFDLVFCGGTVLRMHQRLEYRQNCETTRLRTSQLVLALGRIRRGGTLVAVMHRADAWDSVILLQTFSRFAHVQLFKPRTGHVRRSSFYMVARNVQPQRPEAAQAIERWKKQWRYSTFGFKAEEGTEGLFDASRNAVERVLEEFGERLVLLSTPIFKIQAEALHNAPWTNNKR